MLTSMSNAGLKVALWHLEAFMPIMLFMVSSLDRGRPPRDPHITWLAAVDTGNSDAISSSTPSVEGEVATMLRWCSPPLSALATLAALTTFAALAASASFASTATLARAGEGLPPPPAPAARRQRQHAPPPSATTASAGGRQQRGWQRSSLAESVCVTLRGLAPLGILLAGTLLLCLLLGYSNARSHATRPRDPHVALGRALRCLSELAEACHSPLCCRCALFLMLCLLLLLGQCLLKLTHALGIGRCHGAPGSVSVATSVCSRWHRSGQA